MKYLAFFPVLFLFLLSFNSSNAGQENWNKGVVFLQSGEVVKGELLYDNKLNLLQCKAEGVMKVFVPHQVKLFQYYDQALSVNRVYTPLADQTFNSGQHEKFYELVLTGEITLLRNNPRTVIRQLPSGPAAGTEKDNITFSHRYVETTQYNYYLLWNDQLINLDQGQRKHQLLSLLEGSSFDYEAFIKEKNLNVNKIDDLLEVIQHYNKGNKESGISLL